MHGCAQIGTIESKDIKYAVQRSNHINFFSLRNRIVLGGKKQEKKEEKLQSRQVIHWGNSWNQQQKQEAKT